MGAYLVSTEMFLASAKRVVVGYLKTKQKINANNNNLAVAA